MSNTLFVGLFVSVVAFLLLLTSLVSFFRGKTVWSFVQLIGAGCLLVVGLCHICEAAHLFPRMRWGFQDSIGHYLDLWSAVLGLTLLPAGYIGRKLFCPHV